MTWHILGVSPTILQTLGGQQTSPRQGKPQRASETQGHSCFHPNEAERQGGAPSLQLGPMSLKQAS